MMEMYTKANLKPDEIATLEIRGLFEEYGYKKYKMNKFEEYNLYATNKDFLTGDKVLTFTDLDGRLMAMRPDVTLSIIKNVEPTNGDCKKLYYVENVYRESKSNSFKEISQVGLECIGNVTNNEIAEVISISAKALNIISKDYLIEISHMSFVQELIGLLNINEENKVKILNLIRDKNQDGIRKVGEREGLSEETLSALCQLPSLYGNFRETLERAKALCKTAAMEEGVKQLEDIYEKLKDIQGNIQLDLSIINDIDYYNGVIFKGYVKNLPESVLAGGQYDSAMKKFGKDAGALGCALYLDEIERLDQINEEKSRIGDMVTVALPKGRLGDQVYNILSEAGYDCPQYKDKSRELVIENKEKNIRYILVKPSDVAVYVEHNAADIGIVGKDILMETEADVYELKDLDIGKCRMAVAAPKGYEEDPNRTLRIATKYVNVAKKFYQERNRVIEIIKLNGSIELGPLLDLSDVIVDIVETGNTLRENNLEVIEEFKNISARLIANKSSYKFKNKVISHMVRSLGE